MSYNNYVLLYLFFIISFFLEVESLFTPRERLGHSSVLVENKLYFFGGAIDENNNLCSNEVFYLDVSQPFNMQTPLWTDITPGAGIPFRSCFSTIAFSDVNNEQTIYLFGGITRDIATNNDYNFTSMIYSLNLNSLKWDSPFVKGNPPARRKETKSIIDDTGKIYTFSGVVDETIGSTTIQFLNDMAIFNTVDSSWTIISAPVSGRASNTATLLTNGVIIYIGGYEDTPKDVDISQIILYDTKSSTWNIKTAKFIDPVDSRDTHTAVLAPNGKIIIHGGTKITPNSIYTQATPNIAVLNTETEPFEWSAPFVSSNIGENPTLAVHTSNIVGNYMISAFGNITQPNGDQLIDKNSKIYILDVRNYTWVNSFEPSTPSNTTSPNPNSANDSVTTMKIVIETMSGIFGTAILIGFFGYRWYKKRQGKEGDFLFYHHVDHFGN